MSESKARARHRAANNGAEPDWARVGYKNPRKLKREQRYAVAALVARIKRRAAKEAGEA